MAKVTNAELKKRLKARGLTVVDWRTKRMKLGGFPMAPEKRTDGTVGHHGASVRAKDSVALKALMRVWWALHVITNGWVDVFYGVVIADDGSVAIGRGLETTYGRAKPGAPVATFCFPGWYTAKKDSKGRGGDKLTDAQKATALIVIEVFQEAGVGTEVQGHVQYTNDSTCPGENGLAFINSLVDTGIPGVVAEQPALFDFKMTDVELVQRGDRGEMVESVQGLLIARGYGEHFGYRFDGMFSKRMERATELFQAANGLTEDGIVGRKTLKALLATGN